MSDFEFNQAKDATPETEDVGAEDKAPAKTAEEAKTTPKYDKDELLQIFDELMFGSEYVGEVVVNKKLKVSFRTRSLEETMAISKELDSMTYNFITTLQEQRAVLNLAHSLVNYHGKDLSQMKPLPDRMKFIMKLPIQIIGQLTDKLAEFDMKVDAACKEGEENF